MDSAFQKASAYKSDRANLTVSLGGLIQALPENVQDLVLGACVYELYDRNMIVMVANAEGAQSNVEHHRLLSERLLQKKLNLQKTSLVDSLEDRSPVTFKRSKFSLNHECMNVVLQNGGRFDQTIVQVAFKKPNTLKYVLPEQAKQQLIKTSRQLIEDIGLQAEAKTFNQKYAGKWDHFTTLGRLESREGFLSYFDLKGSSKVEASLMHPTTYEFLKDWRDVVIVTTDKRHANKARGYGDDLFAFYPAADMNDFEKTILFVKNVLPAAEEVHEWYEDHKSAYKSQGIKDSFAKVAISYGTVIPTIDADGSYTDEGKPFYRADALMDSLSLSTKTGFISVDDTVIPFMGNTKDGFKSVDRKTLNNKFQIKQALVRELG